jgi:ABC-type amino acid transport substrate-binding protein
MLPRALNLLLALMSLSVLAPPARAQAPLPLIDAGKLTWGASITFPPFESLADGKPVGFVIDMVDAITAKMKVQASMTTMEFRGLIPALLGGRIDAIVSGMYINGIGVSKEKPALKEAVETALKAVTADGVIIDLIKKYGLPPDSAL